MADRSVSVSLRLDVTGFTSSAERAARAIRRIAEEAERAGRRTGQSFEESEEAARRQAEAFRESEEGARRQAEETERARRSTERHTESTETHTEATENNSEATDRLGGAAGRAGLGMTELVGAGLAAAGALTIATVAAGAFGLTAIPTIYKVIAAQEDLSESWQTLSGGQKAAALSVQGLTDDFQGLAKSYEPEALALFGSALGTARQALPLLDKVVRNTSGSVLQFTQRLGAFSTGPQMQGFLDTVSKDAPAALDKTSGVLVQTGTLSLRLLQDLTPLGLSFLTVANGALGLANAAAHVNPAIAQLAVTGLLLRRPIGALVGTVGALPGRFAAASAASRGMSASQRALNMVTRAGPHLYVAAGVALAYFAVRAMNAKSSTDKLVESLRIENRATGNNLNGHKAQTRALEQQAAVLRDKVISAQTDMSQAAKESIDPARAQSREVARYKSQLNETEKALKKQSATTVTVQASAELLSAKYRVTRTEALSLATAAGVDLTTAMDKNGRLTNEAAAKIQQYADAVAAAKNPTLQVKLALDSAGNSALTMKDRVSALTSALDAFFNPSIAVFKATTELRQGFGALTKTLEDTRKKYGANRDLMNQSGQASLRLRTAFASQLEAVSSLRTAIFQKTGSMKAANAEVAKYLPKLFIMSGGSREARAQIDAMTRSFGISTSSLGISRNAFIKQAVAITGSRKRAEELWREFAKIPGQSKHVADGMSSMRRRVVNDLNAIPSRNIRVSIFADGRWVEGATRRARELATGGPVLPAWATGRGGPRDDDVPALLSVGEHVIPADEVRAAGGQAGIYRMRQAIRSARVPAFAAGGPVGLSIALARTPSSGEIAQATKPVETLADMMVGTWSAAAAAAWKKYASQGGAGLAFARGEAGKPYVWGGVGPGGYDCCLVGSSRVYGPDGAKPIRDVQAGDRVYAHVDGLLQTHTVTAAWQSRRQPVFAVRTRDRTVTGSANHPFLKVVMVEQPRRVRGGRRGEQAPARYDVQWARLDELKRGDLLVQPRAMRCEPHPHPVLADGTAVDTEVAWLIGASVADGTVTDRSLRLRLYGEDRIRAARIIATRWGRKRVPDDVWLWPEECQRSFLDGYCDADGHRPENPRRHGERTYSSASPELIADIRAMHIMLGDPVSNGAVTGRDKPITIKGRLVKRALPLHTFTVWQAPGRGEAALRRRPGLAEWLDAGDFTPAPVLEVSAEGEQDTWDIEVEGAHNFIADGVVVHNSGFMSAITNVIQGRSPYSRLFSTASFGADSGPGGFVRNAGSAFQVGVTDAGVGHMAGTLAGVNVESSGGQGVHLGAGARGAHDSLFQRVYGLRMASGGEVEGAERGLARRALRREASARDVAVAARLGLVGDPGSPIGPGYATGGGVERHDAQISRHLRVWSEPETGGEAYIPLAASKRPRSVDVLSQVAGRFGLRVTRMADGGVLDGDLNLSDYLSRWGEATDPASAADVAAAKKNRAAQAAQASAAQRALTKAKRSRDDKIHDAVTRVRRAYGKPARTAAQRRDRAEAIADAREALARAKRTDTVRAAEAKLRKERGDLAAATKKIADTERRYQAGRLSPAAKLGSALDLGIKNSGAFISNLTKLSDRGFGALARNLLAMGGTEAEKIAADAVKMSDKSLGSLQGKMGKAEQQRDTLANLPNILTVRSTLKALGAQAGSWVALLRASDLTPGDLATSVHLIEKDLVKTPAGRALLADMKRHGYRAGGRVSGPGGIDNVPIWATAGEYVINRRSSAKYAPLIRAINEDRIGAPLMQRHARGGWVGGVRGGDGAALGGPQITQNFYDLPFSPAQMAREAAREAAWQVGAA